MKFAKSVLLMLLTISSMWSPAAAETVPQMQPLLNSLNKVTTVATPRLTHFTLSFSQPPVVSSALFDAVQSRIIISFPSTQSCCPEQLLTPATQATLREFGILSYYFNYNYVQRTLDLNIMCNPTLQAIGYWYQWCNVERGSTDYRLEFELCNQYFLTQLRSSLSELPTIILDPGHGGQAMGTCWYNLQEKNLTLAIAHDVDQTLRAAGFRTQMTRYDDSDISLDARATTAINQHNALFVSIHANATEAPLELLPLIHGLETYSFNAQEMGKQLDAQHLLFINMLPTQQIINDFIYRIHNNTTQSHTLANIVHQSVLETVHAAYPTLLDNRGIRNAHFRVLLLTSSTTPAMLVEVGYISNQQESIYLSDANYRAQLARGIAQGIINYAYQARK